MLKAGTETGSLMNHLFSREVGVEPAIGMGATLLHWTDRDPATVVAWDGKLLTVQEDSYKRVDKNGMSESQEYEYTPNPQGSLSHFKRDKNGGWFQVIKNPETGRFNKRGGGLRLGERERYYDFSF